MHEITRPLARSLQVGKPCFGVLRPVLGGTKQAFHKGVVVADAGARVLAHLFSLQSPHDALDVTAACLLTTAPPLALPESDPWPRVPDGQVKFPHPWPPQIPPGRTAGL